MMASLRSYKNLLWKKREAVKNLKKSQFCVWKSVNAVQCFSQGLCPPQYRARSGTRCKIKLLNFFCPEILPRLNVVWFFSWNVFFIPKKKLQKPVSAPRVSNPAKSIERNRTKNHSNSIEPNRSYCWKLFGEFDYRNQSTGLVWVCSTERLTPSRELRPNLQRSSHIWASEATRLPKILILVHFFQKLLICPLKHWQIAWNLEFLRKELKKRCDYYE